MTDQERLVVTTFRTTEELRRRLAAAAVKERRTLSNYIHATLEATHSKDDAA